MAGSIATHILNRLGYVKAVLQGGKYFYTLGGSTPGGFWGERSYHEYLKDFIEIPELNAIINYKARAASKIKIKAVDKKTLATVTSNDPALKLLKRPNWFQSLSEFIYQQELYRSIFGNEYWYFLTPVGFGGQYKAMYALPSQNMFVKCPDKLFYLNASIPGSVEYYFKLQDEKTKYPIETDEIIHLTNNRVTFRPDKQEGDTELRTNYLYGTSKLSALSPMLKNLRLAHEGRHTLRNLPAGVLTNNAKDAAGTVSLDDKEKKDLQERLNSTYGLSVEKSQLIITNLNLRLAQTIVDIDKLKLYEETEEDTAGICDAFGVPYELVGSKNGVTYENKRNAEKQLYEDTIIPESQDRIEALNDQFETESKSWELIGDFSHLPVFQENRKEKAETLDKVINALSKALADGAINIETYQKELAKLGIGDESRANN